MNEKYGKLEIGSPANLTLFYYHTKNDKLQIIRTIRMGEIIF